MRRLGRPAVLLLMLIALLGATTPAQAAAINCDGQGRVRNSVMANYTAGLVACSDDGGNVGP